MKTPAIIGIVMIVLGAVALAYQGFTWTTREKVVDIGPIEIHDKERHSFPLPPIVGGALVIGGVVLLVAGSRKR